MAAASAGWSRGTWRRFASPTLRTLLVAIAALAVATAARASQPQWTQSFDLVPGWNAIYLHVSPNDSEPANIFDGIPVRSVWTRGTETSSVEFIRNPDDALLGQRGWVAYIPANREEALAATLADRELVSIEGNRAFLIYLDGPATTLRITGRPLVPLINWQANAYTLTGFPIDPNAAPTFAAYFAPSAAQRGQPVYHLLPSGVWERIAAPNAATMRYGEAYWVYSASGSDYLGPIRVDVPTSDGVSFGRGVSQHLLALVNLSAAPLAISIQDLASPTALPLSYRTLVTSGPNAGTVQWPALSGALSLPTTAGGAQSARLAVRRSALAQPEVGSVLAIRGAGMRWLLPLSVKSDVAAAAVSGSGGSSAFAGLWVGAAEVRKVSQPQIGSLTPVSTQGQGNVCTGGANEGLSCTGPTDCPGVCTLTCAGGSKAGTACTVATQATDCPGSSCTAPPRACAGGINLGLPCSAASDCPGSSCGDTAVCAGGARAGQSCSPATAAQDCPGSTCNSGSRCLGGVNDNRSCARAADCAFRCDQSGGGSTFSMRLLIHVDGSGTTRLLKQVIQMWQNGTTRPDRDDPQLQVDATPGRYVLLTDDGLIPTFRGAALRDGIPVGRRLSTAHFDFPGNELAMTGDFGGTGALTAAIVLTPDFPTNPYRHKFHPDHDNLDPQGRPTPEAFQIQRAIRLTFSGTDPSGLSDPDYGFDTVGGTYAEELQGLHRSPIQVEGIFRLQRISTTPELNR